MKSKMTPAIFLRLGSEKEKQEVRKEAKRLGMSIASFLRLLIRQYFDGIKFEREQKDK